MSSTFAPPLPVTLCRIHFPSDCNPRAEMMDLGILWASYDCYRKLPFFIWINYGKYYFCFRKAFLFVLIASWWAEGQAVTFLLILFHDWRMLDQQFAPHRDGYVAWMRRDGFSSHVVVCWVAKVLRTWRRTWSRIPFLFLIVPPE